MKGKESSMRGIATVVVTTVCAITKVAQNSAVLSATSNQQQWQQQQHPPLFFQHKYQNIPRYFSLSEVPLSLESVFGTVDSSSRSLTPSNSFSSNHVDSVCYFLLAILCNLLLSSQTVDELLAYNKFMPLMELLTPAQSSTHSYNSLASETSSLWALHKQVVRVLATLASTSCRDVTKIQMLKEQVMCCYVMPSDESTHCSVFSRCYSLYCEKRMPFPQ